MKIDPTAALYVDSINTHDVATFQRLFADAAVVDDAGRELRGIAAIKDWSDREIFGVQVTLEVVKVQQQDDQTVLTTKVDGNFDRTGLPNPVIINHDLQIDAGKISKLTCRLAK